MSDIESLRKEIDAVDDKLVDLMVKRFQVVSQIGEYKAEHGIQAKQSARFDELLARLKQRAESQGLDPEVIEAIWSALHEETIAYQEKLAKN